MIDQLGVPSHPFPWRYHEHRQGANVLEAWLEASDGFRILVLYDPPPYEIEVLKRAAAAFELAEVVIDQGDGYLKRRAGEVLGEFIPS